MWKVGICRVMGNSKKSFYLCKNSVDQNQSVHKIFNAYKFRYLLQVHLNTFGCIELCCLDLPLGKVCSSCESAAGCSFLDCRVSCRIPPLRWVDKAQAIWPLATMTSISVPWLPNVPGSPSALSCSSHVSLSRGYSLNTSYFLNSFKVCFLWLPNCKNTLLKNITQLRELRKETIVKWCINILAQVIPVLFCMAFT